MARRTKSDKAEAGAEAVMDMPGPNEDQVLDFLRAHPSFLTDHAKSLEEIDAPARPLGIGVSDFQQAMIARLRHQVEETTEVAQELIDTSRDNLNNQMRVHEAVLSLMSATSFEQFIHIVTADLAVILDLDAVALCVEGKFDDFPLDNVAVVPQGFVERTLGAGKEWQLRADISGDPEIYEAAAPLVRSQALHRLDISPKGPAAMIAFASREPEKFHAGQGTDLSSFLTKVVGRLIGMWLRLPD